MCGTFGSYGKRYSISEKREYASLTAVLAAKFAQAATPAYVQSNSVDPQTPQTIVKVPYTAPQSAGNLNVVVESWGETAATVISVYDTGIDTTSSSSLATSNATDMLVSADTVTDHTTGPGAGFTMRILTNPDGNIVQFATDTSISTRAL
jgi:hypothetical protein